MASPVRGEEEAPKGKRSGILRGRKTFEQFPWEVQLFVLLQDANILRKPPLYS